jgi:hypothetical protein
MPAKDYKLCVSGLMGTVFISKVSKANPMLMLSDRVEIPENHFYQLIHQFADAKIDDGFSAWEVKNKDGSKYLTIDIHKDGAEIKEKEQADRAKFVLNYLKHPFEDPEAHLKVLQECAKSMANLVLKILK